MATSWNDPDETTQVFDSERVESAASGSERWYISPDGKTKEVLAAREIIERARAGALSDSTLVWRDGLSDWTRLDAVPELMQAVRAFRASAPSDENLTVVAEAIPTKDGPGPVSLPPLPPLPGAGRSSAPLPPMPAAPGAPRPPIQTISGAPLPPPPSLPPLPGRKSVSDGDIEKASLPTGPSTTSVPATASVAANAAALSLKARALASGMSGLVDKARPVVTSYSNQAKAYLERSYDLPKVGAVSGKMLALGGVGLVVVLFLIARMTADDSTSKDAAATAETPAIGSPTPGTEPATAESGLDLDGAEDNAPAGEPKAVALSELKSLGPGEKAPEVVKESVSRASGGARGGRAKEFDVYAAKAALSAAASKAARCKQGPRGEGSVRVKIAPSGKVVSVTLQTPAFQKSGAAACVEQAFRQASVPPFSGEEKTVYKKFVVN